MMITIRRAEILDVPATAELSYALFQEDAGQRDATMNLNWAREHGVAYFSKFVEEATSIIFVAEEKSRVVGYLAGYVRAPNDYRLVTSADLESMFVEKEFRAQGVGKELVKKFVEWSKEKGAARMTVTAYSQNTRAVAFYQALGFAPQQTTLEMKLD